MRTLPSFPGGKGSPGAPRCLTCSPGAPLYPLGKEARKRGEHSYLCKQRHGSSPCLYSFYINPNRKPFAREDRSSSRVGLWLLPGTVPAPRGPSTLQFTAQGWTQTTKNGSSESGARAKCPSEPEPAITTGHYAHGAISEQRQDTPAPTCARPRASGRMPSRSLCTPVCSGEAASCNLSPCCPRGPRGLHFHLSPRPCP